LKVNCEKKNYQLILSKLVGIVIDFKEKKLLQIQFVALKIIYPISSKQNKYLKKISSLIKSNSIELYF